MQQHTKAQQGLVESPSIKQLLAESKTQIASKLQSHIEDTVSDLQNISPLTQDLKEILLPLALSGKMIRGSLVWYMYQFTRQEESTLLTRDHVLTVAAAFELIQAGLLIHDDIMDNDSLRRGMPTVHVQYHERYGNTPNSQTNIGEHMAICLGDESLFLAMGLIAHIPDLFAAKVMRFIVPQLVKTGIGQSQDVLGASVSALSTTEIETIYLHKTAAYTFTIPLTTGVILANRSEDITFAQVASLGESLGLLFQLRDDYLGIFGESQDTGKNAFSDIAENKKTLIRQALLDQVIKDKKENWFNGIFGNKDITQKDVTDVCEYMKVTGIVHKIELDMDKYHDQALEKVNTIAISKEGRNFFVELITYLRHRNA